MSSSSMLPGGQERFAAARRVPTALSAYFQHHGVWAPGVRLFRSMRFRSKALLISLATSAGRRGGWPPTNAMACAMPTP
jgi:hypothetical protein